MTHPRVTIVISDRDAEREAALDLRSVVFRDGGSDRDRFDESALHGVCRDAGGQVLACFRLWEYGPDMATTSGYTAQVYDLAGSDWAGGPVVEFGRLCMRPGLRDPDLYRLVFSGIARRVVAAKALALFGCASFDGLDPWAYACALGKLNRSYALAGPAARIPAIDLAGFADTDAGLALRQMPPLLRFYLGIGGRVGPQVVPDPDLGTLHVFTVLRVADVPPAQRDILLA